MLHGLLQYTAYERLLLYYFQLLDLRDKEDILDFMKLKSHKRPHVPDEKRD